MTPPTDLTELGDFLRVQDTGGQESKYRQTLIAHGITPVTQFKKRGAVMTHLIDKERRALCGSPPPKGERPHFDAFPWRSTTCRRCLKSLRALTPEEPTR